MNWELVLNIINLVFAFGSNNWLSIAISLIIICFNIYLKVRRQNLLSLVIDNQKDNRSAGDRVAMIFKFKFIIYTLISIYALCFAILNFFNESDNFGSYFKIFKEDKIEDY